MLDESNNDPYSQIWWVNDNQMNGAAGFADFDKGIFVAAEFLDASASAFSRALVLSHEAAHFLFKLTHNEGRPGWVNGPPSLYDIGRYCSLADEVDPWVGNSVPGDEVNGTLECRFITIYHFEVDLVTGEVERVATSYYQQCYYKN